MGRRILIIGASGSGATTLAHHLGSALKTQVFDTDDFYWVPTDPPFQIKRQVPERNALMQEMFLPRSDWVLSGSPVSWDTEIVPRLTHVIFLTLPTPERLTRLQKRENIRQTVRGAHDPVASQIRSGFLQWSAQYDNPHFHGRSRASHEDWLGRVACPVLRLSAEHAPQELTRQALAALDLPGLAD